MAVSFTPTTWVNGAAPGISATELQRIESGIDDTVTAYNAHIGASADQHALADLSNVTASSPSTDDFLQWNGSSWVAAAAAQAIDELTDVTISGTPADDEVLAYNTGTSQWINQTADEAGLLDKTTAGQINGLTNKATPVDNDLLLIEDSAAANAKKKITIGSIAADVSGLYGDLASGSGYTVTVSATAPSSPGAGDIWFDLGSA